MRRNASSVQTIIARVKRATVVIIGDLGLLASLCHARYMVWRTIRARHKERTARPKSLKRIVAGVQALSGNRALMSAGTDEKGMLREAVRDGGFSRRG
ncbi:MAG: hypothetical protein H7Z38_09595 [Rubrivivax sp.]|nr:hypothetical protein [Pyrinomonadaceae bacterium]